MPYICIIPYAKAISKCEGPNALRKQKLLRILEGLFRGNKKLGKMYWGS